MIDIVLPVFNEQAALEQSVRRLHRFLSSEFPFAWRIMPETKGFSLEALQARLRMGGVPAPSERAPELTPAASSAPSP